MRKLVKTVKTIYVTEYYTYDNAEEQNEHEKEMERNGHGCLDHDETSGGKEFAYYALKTINEETIHVPEYWKEKPSAN